MCEIHRVIQVVLVLLIIGNSTIAQQPQNAVPDTAGLTIAGNSIREKLTDFIDPYGSYRIIFGLNSRGDVGVADNASRFGLFGVLPLADGSDYRMFAQMEMGMNLVSRDRVIVFRADPGYGVGEADNALYTRLGFIGIENTHFSFSVGKQWSAYYDVAAFTDLFYAFGAEASGAFNLNSDGGISGTGRANHLFLTRANFGYLKLALQAQARSISENDVSFADTWGASIRYLPQEGLQAGFAFNIVLDGVDQPTINQPMKGDQAWVASVAYVKGRYHVALLGGRYINHDKIVVNDTTSLFFSSYGSELFASFDIDAQKHWRIATGFNYLFPDKNSTVSSYRLLYFLGELSYTFAHASNIFAEVKINSGFDRHGDAVRTNVYGLGFRFSFGY